MSVISDKDYHKMVRFALDEPDTRYCIFMKRVAGYRFFPIDGVVCVPKYILYERLKHYPHNLELLEQGIHPEYRRVIKDDFDQIQEGMWENTTPK